MALRLAKVSGFYVPFLEQIYQRSPKLADMPYSEQHRALMQGLFGWSDFWKKHLEALGRFEVGEWIVNAKPLQLAWARERGIAFSAERWEEDILEAQIKEANPDILFAHDFTHIGSAWRLKLRKELPSLRFCIGWDGVHRMDPARFRGCDMILSGSPAAIDFYSKAGFQTRLFRLGFEESILTRCGPTATPETEVVFTGSINPDDNTHTERIRFLAEVARKVPLALHLQAPKNVRLPLLFGSYLKRGRVADAMFKLPKRIGQVLSLNRRNRGPVYGLEMYRTLARAKICLNIHHDTSGNLAGNMRLFEATGMGACLLTDNKSNLGSYFEIGREVATFESPADCIARIKELLADEPRRAAIARAGQARTLRDHSLGTQIQQFGRELLQRVS